MTKKILVFCQAGAVRSVTLAWIFRTKFKIDALATSLYRITPATKKMLCDWADKIVVVEEGMEDDIDLEYTDKVVFLNVGVDIWLQSLNPDLTKKCLKLIEEKMEELDL